MYRHEYECIFYEKNIKTGDSFQCKPEQVQVVRDCEDPPTTPGGKRERLQYSVGDVITVLDKRLDHGYEFMFTVIVC